MQAFKVKAFAKWASGEGLNDDALASAAALTKATKVGELIEIEVNDDG